MCWVRIAYCRQRMRQMCARCSQRSVSARDLTSIPLRRSARVATLSASHANGLLLQRQAVIRVRRGLFYRASIPPSLLNKDLFDDKGFHTMTNISPPTTLMQLVARSRKLGAERSICNWGGGNTSAKADEVDFRDRPAREVALSLRAKPDAKLVILAKHGLITWGETDEACYASTLETITRARNYVEARIAHIGRAVFGGARITTPSAQERRAVAAQVAPILRGLVSDEKWQVLRFEDGEDILTFSNSQDALRLTKIGAACPDHLVHTKPWPLLVDWEPEQGSEKFVASLRAGMKAYVAKYRSYLKANERQNLDPDAAVPVQRANDAASNPHPRVILIPGVGMFTTGKDAAMADVSAQLYHRAIAVMRGAEACGGFISLNDAESYAVEYW